MHIRTSIIDDTGLTEAGIEALRSLSGGPVAVNDSDPVGEEEIIERIGDAEAVFASWRPKLTRAVIESCPNLRYVGMCCTIRDAVSTNIDLDAAHERSITVRGVRDHADQGAAEFVIAQLTRLYMGLGCDPWHGEAGELFGKSIGIIGLGAVGRLLADHALAFGMSVIYHTRHERRDLHLTHIEYRTKSSLLEEADIVSLQVPRGSIVMGEAEFAAMKEKSIFINTSLHPCFDHEAFGNWIEESGHYGIFDAVGAESLAPEIVARQNVATIDRVAGWTREARVRLTASAIENFSAFLARKG